MRFIGTVTLFAGFFQDEKHHSGAKKTLEEIVEGKIRNIVYSDYILDELLTLTRAKKGPMISRKILEEILYSELGMLKVEQSHLQLAYEIFKKYENLSFTDSTTVALMLDLGIKEIYSFDSDFDSVPGITRLEE